LIAEDLEPLIFEKSSLGNASLDKLKLNLNTYIEHGGFPETTGLEPQDRNRLLQDYVSTVIFRDIIERYHITNISLIRQLIKTLIKNVGTSQSTHKLFNDLKSQGFAVGKETIHDYLEHITDAYLGFRIPLYSESLRKVESNPRKTYAIDTGLVRAYSTGFLDNIGHLFENLVYLDLRRHGHEVHYYLTKTRKEIDFLSKDPFGKWHLYQVCWNMDNIQTRKREEDALKEAEVELGIKGAIITPETYFNFGPNNLSV
jgi:predicted AAA+ superfamily ATPase